MSRPPRGGGPLQGNERNKKMKGAKKMCGRALAEMHEAIRDLEKRLYAVRDEMVNFGIEAVRAREKYGEVVLPFVDEDGNDCPAKAEHDLRSADLSVTVDAVLRVSDALGRLICVRGAVERELRKRKAGKR